MFVLSALALILIVPGLLGADKAKGPKVTDKVSQEKGKTTRVNSEKVALGESKRGRTKRGKQRAGTRWCFPLVKYLWKPVLTALQ